MLKVPRTQEKRSSRHADSHKRSMSRTETSCERLKYTQVLSPKTPVMKEYGLKEASAAKTNGSQNLLNTINKSSQSNRHEYRRVSQHRSSGCNLKALYSTIEKEKSARSRERIYSHCNINKTEPDREVQKGIPQQTKLQQQLTGNGDLRNSLNRALDTEAHKIVLLKTLMMAKRPDIQSEFHSFYKSNTLIRTDKDEAIQRQLKKEKQRLVMQELENSKDNLIELFNRSRNNSNMYGKMNEVLHPEPPRLRPAIQKIQQEAEPKIQYESKVEKQQVAVQRQIKQVTFKESKEPAEALIRPPSAKIEEKANIYIKENVRIEQEEVKQVTRVQTPKLIQNKPSANKVEKDIQKIQRQPQQPNVVKTEDVPQRPNSVKSNNKPPQKQIKQITQQSADDLEEIKLVDQSNQGKVIKLQEPVKPASIYTVVDKKQQTKSIIAKPQSQEIKQKQVATVTVPPKIQKPTRTPSLPTQHDDSLEELDTETSLQMINLIGQTVGNGVKSLKGIKVDWTIPCYFIYKIFYQLREKLEKTYEKLVTKGLKTEKQLADISTENLQIKTGVTKMAQACEKKTTNPNYLKKFREPLDSNVDDDFFDPLEDYYIVVSKNTAGLNAEQLSKVKAHFLQMLNGVLAILYFQGHETTPEPADKLLSPSNLQSIDKAINGFMKIIREQRNERFDSS